MGGGAKATSQCFRKGRSPHHMVLTDPYEGAERFPQMPEIGLNALSGLVAASVMSSSLCKTGTQICCIWNGGH